MQSGSCGRDLSSRRALRRDPRVKALPYLWRTVDQNGDMIDILMHRRQNRRAGMARPNGFGLPSSLHLRLACTLSGGRHQGPSHHEDPRQKALVRRRSVAETLRSDRRQAPGPTEVRVRPVDPRDRARSDLARVWSRLEPDFGGVPAQKAGPESPEAAAPGLSSPSATRPQHVRTITAARLGLQRERLPS